MREIEELEHLLKEKNLKCETSKKTDSPGILGCLKKIDDADIVYVVNPQGYVGKSVSVDLGYAFARGKSIFVMNRIEDPPMMNLTSGVLSPKKLVELLKANSSQKG